MKRLSLFAVALAFIFVGCSAEDEMSATGDVANQVHETGETRAGGPPSRVSVTGNQDFRLQARQRANGNASGFWVDNQTGIRVDVECIFFFDDGTGNSAILTGTVNRGPQSGMQFAVRVLDGNTDGLSMRIPAYQTCEELNPLYLFPIPIQNGNVKVD